MATTFEVYSINSGYTNLVESLVSKGSRLTSRVGNVVELEDVTIVIENPTHALSPARRGFAPLLGFAEGCQLAGGFSADERMLELFPAMASFTDFYGTYGKRSSLSISHVLNALKTSSDTRRAVIGLWDAALDAPGEHLDHPCTLAINFRIRDGKLNMTVHMRSNDIIRGLQYDSIQFALLQTTLANMLDISVGTYVHHADSFHLYERDFGIVDDLFEADRNRVDDEVYTVGPIGLSGWNAYQLECEAVYALQGQEDQTLTNQGTEIAQLVNKRLEKLSG